MRKTLIATLVAPYLAFMPMEGAASTFEVRLLGLPVGDLSVTERRAGGQYDASARFHTKGLAGALRKVGFDMKARGAVKDGVYDARHYSEDMNTGERESHETVTFGKDGPRMDPMTALLVGLAARAPGDGCAVHQIVFDGKRTHLFTLTTQSETPEKLICRGQFIRKKGYSPAQLKQLSAYEFSAEYERIGNRYIFMRGRARTLHGPVTIVRQ